MKKNKLIESLQYFSDKLDQYYQELEISENKYNEFKSTFKDVLAQVDSIPESHHFFEVPKKKTDSISKKKISHSDLVLPPEVVGKNVFSVYSDGACRGNPGPGAYGLVAQDPVGNVLFEESSETDLTTNNQMELLGAIRGLELMVRYLASKNMSQNTNVYLFTDSRYVVDGIEKWIAGWKERGWKKADKKEPENLELWKRLDFVLAKYKNLKVLWVKGHNGHPQNEYCDQLANLCLDGQK